MKNVFFFVISLYLSVVCKAQEASSYWQQRVSYKMDIDMDVKTFRYKGLQELEYTNNSPDTLRQVFYHLYPNAFQPGSEMDIRLQNIPDPDDRMVYQSDSLDSKPQSRIAKLKPDEIGYIKVLSLKQLGKFVKSYKVNGTILQVTLGEPLLPGAATRLEMSFEGQVPLQIRRFGRNNADGVALSMSQWYPKLAEYDFQGWHADPYIGREFYGVWGDFDVKIKIDKNYILGGTGYLQNADEIGYGYRKDGASPKVSGKKNVWHFVAPNVHDFTWAADPAYNHDKVLTGDGVTLHFLYKGDEQTVANWKKIQQAMPKVFTFFEKEIGPYPWKQYSFIQGGDGGMEYAMCTLITGGKTYNSLEGTAIHELAHSWFQQILASNESLHAWMDEGFTTYISSKAQAFLRDKTMHNPLKSTYDTYAYLYPNLKDPQTTHSDRYVNNMSYSVNAYVKGALFLSQLGYITGENTLKKIIKCYYNDFKMKHPTPNDIIRTAEKVSGMQLQWYLNEWTETLHAIDYSIEATPQDKALNKIRLKRIGDMPMPIDILVTFKDGKREWYNIPVRMMYNHKKEAPEVGVPYTILPDWAWAYPDYEWTLRRPVSEIKSVEIDPWGLMADINRKNNQFVNE